MWDSPAFPTGHGLNLLGLTHSKSSATEHNRTRDWKYPKQPWSHNASELTRSSGRWLWRLKAEPGWSGVFAMVVNMWAGELTLLVCPLISPPPLGTCTSFLGTLLPVPTPSTWLLQKELQKWCPSVANFQANWKGSLGNLKLREIGVPIVAQQKRIQLGTMGLWVWSLASLTG